MKRNGFKILNIMLVLVLLAGLLTGCAEIITPSQPTTPSYTVTFLVNGQTHREQRVEEGAFPKAVDTSLQGIQVIGWKNEAGELVDPTAVAVTGNTQYTLSYYPVLGRHVPYLFVNENGQLKPDDGLTEGQFKQAMEALAVGGAKAHFPELPQSDNVLGTENAAKLLHHFFPKDQIQEAMPEGEKLTRSDFAKVMNKLLGRDAEKKIKPEDGFVVPADLTSDREDAVSLLEAVMPHAEAENGIAWADIDLPTTLEPGFLNLDGYLYYITEDGYYLKDGKVGTLYFGSNGRYTTGDTELDDLVAQTLQKIMKDHPDAKGEDLLYQIYVYCRDSFKYVTRGILESGATGWEVEWSKQMLQTRAGNCYSYNATFWALARGIGYDAYCYSGYTAKDYQPHGWCQIDIDGETFIFDPQLGMRYLQNGKNHNMFKLPYERAVRWPYHWPDNAKK